MSDGVTDKKFIIPHGSEWLRPDEAYFQYQEQAKGHTAEEIANNGKYKAIRELRDLAAFGLAIFAATGDVFLVQMNTHDPSPDAFVLTKSKSDELTHGIAPVELTFYGRNALGLPQQTLLEKLMERGGKFEKLPEGYGLLIHIGIGLEVNHQEITDELKRRNAKFQVFSLQEVSNHPDTILRFATYLPELEVRDLNVGQAVVDIRKTNTPRKVTQVRGRPPDVEVA